MDRRRRGVSGATFLVVLGFVLGLSGLAYAATRPEPTPALTYGRVPINARLADGSPDMSAVPDLISVTDDRLQVVGYAYASDILEPSAQQTKPRLREGVIEVWDKTGRTLVGHLYPNGAGFLSLEQQAVRGVSPASPPPSRMTPSTVMLRP
jgi:hypothetical protein